MLIRQADSFFAIFIFFSRKKEKFPEGYLRVRRELHSLNK